MCTCSVLNVGKLPMSKLGATLLHMHNVHRYYNERTKKIDLGGLGQMVGQI